MNFINFILCYKDDPHFNLWLCALAINFHHISGKYTESMILFGFKDPETGFDFHKY